jgi:hypothetical protein
MRSILISIFLLSIILACSSDQNDKTEYLPKANGKPGDILIVIDSIQWNGQLGDELRRVFEAEVPGLPQGEPMFKVINMQPTKGMTMLGQMRNLVYVFTLDQNTSGSKILRKQFSEETINKIRSDSTFNISTRTDEFAKGQYLMYLFDETEAGLIAYLKKNKQSIIDYFNIAERKRLTAEIFKTKSTRGLVEFLKKEQQCSINIPVGFKVADRTSDFVWLRSPTAETDKDIFISWKPYVSEYQLLPDSLIDWRNQICKKYLYEDPENPEGYLVTELEDAKVSARQVKLNEHFSMELRGLWRTNLRTMGGPFLGYALVDEPRNLLYYIEGFAYAPGRDKREIMRELETILWTFRTSAEIPKAK